MLLENSILDNNKGKCPFLFLSVSSIHRKETRVKCRVQCPEAYYMRLGNVMYRRVAMLPSFDLTFGLRSELGPDVDCVILVFVHGLDRYEGKGI